MAHGAIFKTEWVREMVSACMCYRENDGVDLGLH
jgi:phenolic acid decarboxylase